MNLDKAIRLLAGSMVLISVVLTLTLSPWWLLLTTFVGLNLVQSSLTGFCPAESVLGRLPGLQPGSCGCPDVRPAAYAPTAGRGRGAADDGEQIRS